VGFPLDENKWSGSAIYSAGTINITCTTENVLYTNANFTISVPIGLWKIYSKMYASPATSSFGVTISNTNTQNYPQTTRVLRGGTGIPPVPTVITNPSIINVATKTDFSTYVFQVDASGNVFYTINTGMPYMIKYTCAYL